MKSLNKKNQIAGEKKPPGPVVSSAAYIKSICEADYAYL
jgi:hypothetical protein